MFILGEKTNFVCRFFFKTHPSKQESTLNMLFDEAGTNLLQFFLISHKKKWIGFWGLDVQNYFGWHFCCYKR